MAYEVEAVIRFNDGTVLPRPEDIEAYLDCVVIEWLVEEV